jgi:hypothetical protein
VALGFRGEALHQEDDNEATENRRKEYPVAEPARPFADIGIVPDAERAAVKPVVKQSDQRPECDGANAGHNAHDQCETAENQEIYFPLVVAGQ